MGHHAKLYPQNKLHGKKVQSDLAVFSLVEKQPESFKLQRYSISNLCNMILFLLVLGGSTIYDQHIWWTKPLVEVISCIASLLLVSIELLLGSGRLRSNEALSSLEPLFLFIYTVAAEEIRLSCWDALLIWRHINNSRQVC